MQQEDRTTFTREGVPIDGLSKVVRMGEVNHRKDLKERVARGSSPILGAENTNFLCEQDVGSGLFYLFAMLRQDTSSLSTVTGREWLTSSWTSPPSCTAQRSTSSRTSQRASGP